MNGVDLNPERPSVTIWWILLGLFLIGFVVVVGQRFFPDRTQTQGPPRNLLKIKGPETEVVEGEEKKKVPFDPVAYQAKYPSAITNYIVANPPEKATHPLEPALVVAKLGLDHIQKDIQDYTATIIKRERVDGKLGQVETLFAKIRNRKLDAAGNVVVPFGVYLRFLSPPSIANREVIYVEGANAGKLRAHEGGILNILTVNLDPHGALAMRGNRYPITDIGIENLITKMMEKGERDKALGDCAVTIERNFEVNDRIATKLTIRHDKPNEVFDFHVAEIFIDDEINIPIRYAAYSWPEIPGAEPTLLEEYTYTDLKLNVGLTDIDFDSKNPAYKF